MVYENYPTSVEEEYVLYPCVHRDEEGCCALSCYLCMCFPYGCSGRVEPYDTKEDRT